jgi:hypothetical protein
LGSSNQSGGGALLGDIPFPFLKRGYRWAVIYAPAIRTARVTKRFKIRPVRGPLPRPDRRWRKGQVPLLVPVRRTAPYELLKFERLGRRGKIRGSGDKDLE